MKRGFNRLRRSLFQVMSTVSRWTWWLIISWLILYLFVGFCYHTTVATVFLETAVIIWRREMKVCPTLTSVSRQRPVSTASHEGEEWREIQGFRLHSDHGLGGEEVAPLTQSLRSSIFSHPHDRDEWALTEKSSDFTQIEDKQSFPQTLTHDLKEKQDLDKQAWAHVDEEMIQEMRRYRKEDRRRKEEAKASCSLKRNFLLFLNRKINWSSWRAFVVGGGKWERKVVLRCFKITGLGKST